MSEIILIGLLLACMLHYLAFLWSIRKGLSDLSNPGADAKPFSSVVIAARNEENNIERCIRALIDQSYDPQLYEIIVVDDHSQDNTGLIASRFSHSSSSPQVTLLALTEQSGKPSALARGISAAKGEIILSTDADCTVPKNWVESMVRCFDPSTAFVAGPVLEVPSGSLFSRLQAIEYLSLTTTAAGLIGSGKPIICSGASVAYRKSVFTNVNGYGDLSSACDDETLMHRIFHRGAGTVRFNSDSSSIITTPTPPGASAFWSQRTRWASKKGHYEDSSVLGRLLILYAFFFLLFVAGTIAFFEPVLRLPVASLLMIKGIADYVVLSQGSRMFRLPIPFWQFLIAELFHVPYIAVAGMIGQLNSLRWKDRKLDR